MGGSRIMESEIPFLESKNEAGHGDVDDNGSPGGWRSASFMLVGGSLERFVYFGLESNLISYLSGPIGESLATAAANVNTWTGVASLVPVLGAYLADYFAGRYRSIIVSSILYILGLGFLSLSATIIPTLINSPRYQDMTKKSGTDTGIKVSFLFHFIWLLWLKDTNLAFKLLELINLTEDIQDRAEPRAHFSIGGSVAYAWVLQHHT